MATVDDIKVNINVSGTAQVNQAADGMNKLGNAADSAQKKTKAFAGGARNVSYQIQDIAVQTAMGTSAFIVMGQQLPQLLSGFGLMGAVIGAVAAVSIPLLRVGLEQIGFDFRNLNDRIKDFEKAQQSFTSAAKASMPTIEGLTGQYGNLAGEAGKFYDLQERLAKTTALNQSLTVIQELKDEYSKLNDEISLGDRMLSATTYGAASPEKIRGMRLDKLAKDLGLSVEKSLELGNLIQEIDDKRPEKSVKTINNILSLLEQTNLEGSDFRDLNEELIIPLTKIQNIYLAISENLKAAGEAQTKLNAQLLEAQNLALPSINDARRRFDEIGALQQEAEFKKAQYAEKLAKQSAKDQVDRTAELMAFELRVNQELADKIADIRAKQEETTRSIQAATDSKARQLQLESNILNLNTQGLRSSFDILTYEKEILKNQTSRIEAVVKLEEQLRKNVITQEQFNLLKQDALAMEEHANALAQKGLQIRAEQFLAGQDRLVKAEEQRLKFSQSIITLSDRERKNAQEIFNLQKERNQELKALENLQDPAKQEALKQKIISAYEARISIAKEAAAQEQANRENFELGWERALNNYVDNSKDAFKQAEDFFKQTTQGMEDAIVKFARTGKLEWKNLIADMLETLLRSQIQQVMAKTLALGSSGGGTFGSSLGNFFSGFFANGGFIPGGTFGIVGERGPELITGPANVTPIQQSPNVVYNINAVDALSFRQLVARDPGFIHAVAMKGGSAIPSGR
jgi:lambda family phage tail tape measure protein